MRIKLACSACGIYTTNMIRNRFGSTDVNRMSTALPEQELYNAFDIRQVGFEIRVSLGIDQGFKPRDFATASFQTDHESHSNCLNLAPENSIRQHGGTKTFVQWRF